MILRLKIRNHAEQCVSMIVKHLKDQGFGTTNNYERKRKISEAEVTSAAYDGCSVANLQQAIQEWEGRLKLERNDENFNHL